MSFTMPYSKLYILTELSANDIKFVSVDRQKLDLLKYIYLWYRLFYICRDTAHFYDVKNDPRIFKLVFTCWISFAPVFGLIYC